MDSPGAPILPAGMKLQSGNRSRPITVGSQIKDTNASVTRWFLAHQDFHFKVLHRAGASHGNTDGLLWLGRITWSGIFPSSPSVSPVSSQIVSQYQDTQSVSPWKRRIQPSTPADCQHLIPITLTLISSEEEETGELGLGTHMTYVLTRLCYQGIFQSVPLSAPQ